MVDRRSPDKNRDSISPELIARLSTLTQETLLSRAEREQGDEVLREMADARRRAEDESQRINLA